MDDDVMMKEENSISLDEKIKTACKNKSCHLRIMTVFWLFGEGRKKLLPKAFLFVYCTFYKRAEISVVE
jgi:hypothetical protein